MRIIGNFRKGWRGAPLLLGLVFVLLLSSSFVFGFLVDENVNIIMPHASMSGSQKDALRTQHQDTSQHIMNIEQIGSLNYPAGMSHLPPIPGPSPFWTQTFGGINRDEATSVVECSDGGFASVGHTQSFGAGGMDVLLVRSDANGYHLWNQTYGGTGDEIGYALVECSGGDFAIAGYTNSYGAGRPDFWLIRTNSTGHSLWNQTYGGSEFDFALSLAEMSGGGFVIAGWTDSFGAGFSDAWVVRTDASGDHLWNRTYGSTSLDAFQMVLELSGGDIAYTGYTQSFGAGNDDVWLVRTDAVGNHLWNKTYGGSSTERGEVMVECSGGGFAISGWTYSFGAGDTDMWLVRTDSSGNQLWARTYGGSDTDSSKSVVECPAGGFALIGYTYSFDAGNGDMWLVRTDSSGNQLWDQAYGGTNGEMGRSIVRCSFGGFVLTGFTKSFGAGDSDFWFMMVQPVQWVETPINQIVELGISFRYDLNATALYGISQWWLNDTAHFTIDSTGIITNAAPLLIGFYGVLVEVNDTYGDFLIGTFTVKVQDTTPPTWLEIPVDQEVEWGDDFNYDIGASDASGIDHWWINDTTHFAIDENGVITNMVDLVVGIYWLEVQAHDPYTHYCTTTFKVTVQDTTSPIWTIIPIDQVLEPGEALEYLLAATDLSGIDYWTVNDTVHFAISDTGRLTNATLLTPGTYPLRVTVYDLYGNALSATFTIVVQEPLPPPIPGFPAVAIVLGISIALSLGILARRRRRKQ